jgi:hypothetical protein
VTYQERHYSAPDKYVGERVDIWTTPSIVEIYFDRQRIASHRRSYAEKGTFVSDESHLSPAARAMSSWTKERMLHAARLHGEHVERAAERVMNAFPKPQFGFRAVFGILRIADEYGSERLNEACSEALNFTLSAPRRQLLLALLRKQKPGRASARSLGNHEHVRGESAFDFGSHETLENHRKEVH